MAFRVLIIGGTGQVGASPRRVSNPIRGSPARSRRTSPSAQTWMCGEYLYPKLVAAALFAALHTAIDHWLERRGKGGLHAALQRAMEHFGAGLEVSVKGRP